MERISLDRPIKVVVKVPGIQGIPGKQGERGLRGQRGEKGERGDSFIATKISLGQVIIGENVHVEEDGTISVPMSNVAKSGLYKDLKDIPLEFNPKSHTHSFSEIENIPLKNYQKIEFIDSDDMPSSIVFDETPIKYYTSIVEKNNIKFESFSTNVLENGYYKWILMISVDSDLESVSFGENIQYIGMDKPFNPDGIRKLIDGERTTHVYSIQLIKNEEKMIWNVKYDYSMKS